jgi:hypothetical protein
MTALKDCTAVFNSVMPKNRSLEGLSKAPKGFSSAKRSLATVTTIKIGFCVYCTVGALKREQRAKRIVAGI